MDRVVKINKYYIQDSDTQIKKNLSETVLSTGRHYPYILFNPNSKHTEFITSQQKFIWEQLEKPKTIKQLTTVFFEKYQIFASEEIQKLLDKWIESSLIKGSTHIRAQKRNRKHRYSLEIHNINLLIDISYRYFAKIFFYAPIYLFLLSIIGIATGLLIWDIIDPKGYFIPSTNLNLIVLLLIASFSMSLHELAHAYTARFFNTTVSSSGLKFFIGFLLLYVDTTEMWIRPKRERITVASAGILANATLFGISSLLMLLFGPNDILIHTRVINLTAVILNLIPFFGFDGYFILIDLIGLPNLRYYVNMFLLGKWEKLIENLTITQRRFILLYSLVSIAVFIGLTLLALDLWLNSFFPGISTLLASTLV